MEADGGGACHRVEMADDREGQALRTSWGVGVGEAESMTRPVVPQSLPLQVGLLQEGKRKGRNLGGHPGPSRQGDEPLDRCDG